MPTKLMTLIGAALLCGAAEGRLVWWVDDKDYLMTK
jgi:hypothetical protein